jgi:hypothetical protein
VITVKARVRTADGDGTSIIPIVVPGADEVRAMAARLHAAGKPWRGEAFGWRAEYRPEIPAAPSGSKMTFTPADFCIGESGIWFFSMQWENGRENEPGEFLDDRNIVGAVPAAA